MKVKKKRASSHSLLLKHALQTRSILTRRHILMIPPTAPQTEIKALTPEFCKIFKVQITAQNKNFSGILPNINNTIVLSSSNSLALATNRLFLPERVKQRIRQKSLKPIKPKEGK